MGLITTFDGVQHDEHELLEQMLDDDFYYGYLGEQALSSSNLKLLLSSPKQYVARMEGGDESTQALRDGKLFHWRVLEPHKFDELHVVEVASRATKTFKAAAEEFGEVYTRTEVDNAALLADVLLANDEARSYLEDAEFEVPAIKMIEGLAFRGKADIKKGKQIIDVKTTTEIGKFPYSAMKYSYDLQAALYLELFPDAEEFIFLCIDKKTQEIAIYECSQEFIDSGMSKLYSGIDKYKYFFQGDVDVHQYVYHGTL
jgi:hypothetical protein